jgi:hypothetical protein
MSAVVRMAFFEGALKVGREADFFAYANTNLVPLWTRFPELLSFRMRTNASSDDGAHPFVLILEFTYPSRAAMERALASPIRAESREVTKALFDFFDGRISHIVADVADFPTAPRV